MYIDNFLVMIFTLFFPWTPTKYRKITEPIVFVLYYLVNLHDRMFLVLSTFNAVDKMVK